ncbi:MAG: hypothetical protein K2N73_12695 [Lachnospiraceae bacterium]|nr:hypothetical protein [Lachnospiraceae bacterium]
MICIFRQESKKREQDGLSPVATVMIKLQRMISVSALFIPIPPSALRAVYAHVVNCCCFPEDKSFLNLTLDTGWMNPHDRNTYEKANLLNADKLHDLIATLDGINYENKVWDACFLYKEYIPDEKDLRLFYENPLAYEREFRMWNSY